jgi:ABC-2 type transport system ATP-binding protein
MVQAQLRTDEVSHHLSSQDWSLAFRRLLDCVADTQDMQLYQAAIDLCAWHHQNPTEHLNFQDRMLGLLEQCVNIQLPNPVQTEAPILVAHGIGKSYGIGKFILGPISLSITKGQVYGLVGENGNGKTTLLRLLANELHLSSGKIDYHFVNTAQEDYSLRTKLVYIPQRTAKWYGSLKDNLRFVLAHYGTPPQEIEPRLHLMIARLGLWKYQDLHWHQLSSGYKMRFELARTLLRKPEILLLDEPLANLDVNAQQVILEDLKHICNSLVNPIALILSSQQLYEVEKVSDKVIFLKNGQYNDSHPTEATNSEDRVLMIELDTTCSKEELANVLSNIGLSQLQNNGGNFIASFANGTYFNQVLQTLGNSQLPITYVRDISASTRRFFVAS